MACKQKCWPGYERVPGKKCGELGSCRKKSKTKRRKTKRRKTKRRKTKRRKYNISSRKRKSRKRKSRKRKSRRSIKKNMKCNKVMKSYKPGKKFMVKGCSKGKSKLIHFGATGYGHNYSTKARKSFRARHKCHTAKDKLTARYWSCKHSWTRGGNKRRCPKGRRCKR